MADEMEASQWARWTPWTTWTGGRMDVVTSRGALWSRSLPSMSRLAGTVHPVELFAFNDSIRIYYRQILFVLVYKVALFHPNQSLFYKL